jgi:hypothetical protein
MSNFILFFVMKKLIFSVLIMLIWGKNFCQIKVYDSTDVFYSKTDFTFISDISNWNYKLKLRKSKAGEIGKLLFYRVTQFRGNTNNEFYASYNLWIEFSIYHLKDSLKAKAISNSLRKITFCTSPEIGGDYFAIGNFIFVNNVNCIRCNGPGSKDYCRPIVQKSFLNVSQSRIASLKEIVSQFPISDGHK